jgi:replicative DNA helicase
MSNYQTLLEKPLPSSESAERTILGAILVSTELISQAAARLKPPDFYSPFHRKIYGAMLSLFAAGRTIDPIMIGEELKRSGEIVESFGGISTISNLNYGIPRFHDISEWVEIVAGAAKVRNLINACNETVSQALDETQLPETVLSSAQSRINEVCSESQTRGFSSVGNLAVASIHEKLALREKGVKFTGLQTGFDVIDESTGGLQKQELIVLGARPGMGKSALMCNLAENVCRLNENAVVAVFSLEMSEKILTDRMLCSSAQVSANRYKRGLITFEEAERLARVASDFGDYRIEIDDEPGLNPSQIRAKSMMLKARHKRLDFIIVDFLQKMTPSRRAESNRLEIGSIARELKDMAKVLDVPVLAISSLNRECEARNPPKPKMSDLSDSNIIESEADIVVFLYREHYYRPEANPYSAELLFEKNRNGETGEKYLKWTGEFTSFENYYG